jgi:hypothetical protein
MGVFDRLFAKPKLVELPKVQTFEAARRAPKPATKDALKRTTPLFSDDTRTFRTALEAALSKTNPNRLQLVDIYDRCEFELHLLFVLEQRYNSILSKPWMLVDADGQPDEEAKERFSGEWLTAFIRAASKASVRGTQLVQIASDEYPLTSDGLPTYIEDIDQRYFVPEFSIIRDSTAGITGTNYFDKPYVDWVIQIGDKKQLGLMVAGATITILKKIGLSGWAERTNIISGLLRVGKTDIGDDTQKGYMEEALQLAGNLLYMVIGKHDEVEIIDPSQGSGQSQHDTLMQYYDSGITRLFLGQTLTSDTGANGNKALGEVHQQTLDMIIGAECGRIKNIINTELLPRLINAGATWLQGYTFKYDTTERLSLPQLMEFVPKLLPHGRVDAEWLQAKLGVPFEYTDAEVSALPGK